MNVWARQVFKLRSDSKVPAHRRPRWRTWRVSRNSIDLDYLPTTGCAVSPLHQRKCRASAVAIRGQNVFQYNTCLPMEKNTHNFTKMLSESQYGDLKTADKFRETRLVADVPRSIGIQPFAEEKELIVCDRKILSLKTSNLKPSQLPNFSHSTAKCLQTTYTCVYAW